MPPAAFVKLASSTKAIASLRRFVLEAIDQATECAVAKVSFEVKDVDEFCRIIGACPSDMDTHFEYELDASALGDLLRADLSIKFEPGTFAARLRGWRPLDDLPYMVHTGRELALMLKGTKPLAYFYGEYPPNPDVEEIPERLFDSHVAAGTFVKREWITTADNPNSLLHSKGHGSRQVFYALPREEWRINAFILLLKTASKSGWNEGFERIQGSLLGYEDWQNDIFIERIYRPAVGERKE